MRVRERERERERDKEREMEKKEKINMGGMERSDWIGLDWIGFWIGEKNIFFCLDEKKDKRGLLYIVDDWFVGQIYFEGLLVPRKLVPKSTQNNSQQD